MTYPFKPIKPIVGEWYLITTLPDPVKCLRQQDNGFYLVRNGKSHLSFQVHESVFAIHLTSSPSKKPEKKAQKITAPELISKVLADFDFDQVKKVMEALDWKWVHSRTETKVPSPGELVLFARSLLIDVLAMLAPSGADRQTNASGGFCASAEQYEDGEVVLSLDFVVTCTNWSTQDTCY